MLYEVITPPIGLIVDLERDNRMVRPDVIDRGLEQIHHHRGDET